MSRALEAALGGRPPGTAWAVSAALLAGAWSVAAVAGDGPVPLKDFVRHPEFQSAKISPGGEYLALTVPVQGRNALGIVDLKSHTVIGRAKFDKPAEINGFWWSGPEKVVMSYAYGEGPLAQPRWTGQLFSMNADGSQLSPVWPFGYSFMLAPLPHDPDIILVTHLAQYRYDDWDLRDVPVWRFNVRTHQRLIGGTRLPGYAPNDVAVDATGKLRLAVGRNDQRRPVLYEKRDDGSDRWNKITPPGAPPVAAEIHALAADNQSVFLSMDDGGARECLYRYRLDSSTFAEIRCSDGGAVGRPVFSIDGGVLLGLMHEEGRPEFELLDQAHSDGALLLALGKSFGGQQVQVTSSTLDGQKFVVLVSSGRNPGDFYLVERKSRKATYLYSQRSWIDPETMSPVEPITYKTRDGATIHGYLTAPKGLATRKAPLVLMPHGGPHGLRDRWQWDPWAQALASRGYSVLQVNFRGSGGYGMAHQIAGYRKWGTLMQDDLTDAVQWAVAQGIADVNRVCIMGASYGGYAALMSSVREPDLYRCAISLAGIYDVVNWAGKSDIQETDGGRIYLDEVVGDRDLQVAQAPITYVDKLKIPVMIAHGSDDERVPISEARLLRKALDAKGKAYEWLEYSGEEHGLYDESNHEDFLRKAIEFLDKHIGPNSPAAKPAAQTQ